MVAMAECLVDAAGVVSSPQGQRLARLVYETGTPSPLLPQPTDAIVSLFSVEQFLKFVPLAILSQFQDIRGVGFLGAANFERLGTRVILKLTVCISNG